MATPTTAQIDEFIKKAGPIIQKYAKIYGYKVASPILAQACIESAFGASSLGYKYHNYFGMKCGSSWKGKSVNLKTKEEYTVGTLTSITANFRAYDSMDEGIKGYFEFISSKRYANLKTATTAKEFLEMIKADGYATSSKYVQTNMNVVNKYSLDKRFDTFTKEDLSTIICDLKAVMNDTFGLSFTIDSKVDQVLLLNLANVEMTQNSPLTDMNKIVQRLLVYHGYSNVKVDGMFGPTTAAMIGDFQRHAGITQTKSTSTDFWRKVLVR